MNREGIEARHHTDRAVQPLRETSRPFTVLGVHHVAIGGPDKARLTNLWVSLLGLSMAGHFRSDAENVDEDILIAGPGAEAVEIDLMQTLDPTRKPDVTRPALNHIGPCRQRSRCGRRVAGRTRRAIRRRRDSARCRRHTRRLHSSRRQRAVSIWRRRRPDRTRGGQGGRRA